MAKDFKYLAAYIAPFLAFVGLFNGGLWSWSATLFAFGLIPLIEPFLSSSERNYGGQEKSRRLSNHFFDLILYLNVPIVWTLVFMFAFRYSEGMYSSLETFGMVVSLGTVLGASGINVAHELGHRDSRKEQFLAKTLLPPSFYLHFFIEHNRGHHRHVATPEDPATARINESIYLFYIRSIITGYIHAWKLESQRLKKSQIAPFSVQNEMIIFFILQVIYVAVVSYFFGFMTAMLLIAIGLVSFLLLETINYVEHYGLRRNKLPNGRYEVVQAYHSWNSNHFLGRIVLYELTRHSDHHFQSNKKYQVLEHHQDSPQLPYGYPASMILAMIPPLWFSKMNKIVLNNQK